MMRLDKFLADMSFGSRKDVKELIKKKRVCVDGVVAKSADLKVDENNEVTVDGHAVNYVAYEYYLLYKPAGYLSATDDPKYPVVLQLVNSQRKDLFPIGRLDRDAEGVLLITNDGQLAHDLLLPKYHVNKQYYVEVENDLPNDAAQRFKEPMTFKDFIAAPAVDYEQIAARSAYLTINEGKFHQVKRMFAAIGCPVTYLKRVSFAFLNLNGLEKGQSRALTAEEVMALKALRTGEKNES